VRVLRFAWLLAIGLTMAALVLTATVYGSRSGDARMASWLPGTPVEMTASEATRRFKPLTYFSRTAECWTVPYGLKKASRFQCIVRHSGACYHYSPMRIEFVRGRKPGVVRAMLLYDDTCLF
jgi:hypothetical protein